MPTNLGWIVVGGCTTFLIVVTVVATRWGPRWWKAAMFGSAAAIAFAFTAALIKVVSDYAATDWVTLFEHWQTYGVIAFGLLGSSCTQNAFHAGPLAASQSTLVLVDPLVSICLGIALYGDSLRTSGPYGPLEALSLLVMFMGAVFLSNSPLVTGMKSEGKGVEYDEMLSRRLKHHVRPGGRTAGCRSRRRSEPRPGARPGPTAAARRRGGSSRRSGPGATKCRAVLGALDLVHDGIGDVGAQPLRRWRGGATASSARPCRRRTARRAR